MTIWLQAMAEAASRVHSAWNWWGYSESWNTSSSTYSQIAQAIDENKCWRTGCSSPEVEPIGLCEEHLAELRRDPIQDS